ncbi:unnamed protein product [Eruca vesicaria subsp. sativa]|uniref:Uncharacterized protein n=1 Tax=Eruca vesicaria subsp. sativa TaxID=29727 RepID=A0ABC8LHF7_ERUVS|nr:unnamed protein product [Eruca vesicaria subsp. sativa]
MKSWRQIISSIIILILCLGGLRLSYARHLRSMKTPMHSTAEFYEFWRWRRFDEKRMLTVVPSGDDDKNELIYGVSGREAPAGPNPLHNR